MRKSLPLLVVALLLATTAFAHAAATTWDYTSGILQPLASQSAAQVKVPYLTATSTTATSTLPHISSTVFSSATICLTGDTCRTTWPTSSSGVGTVSTSSTPTIGQLAYWTSAGWPSTLGTVATSSLAFSGPFSGASSLGALVGGSNSTVTWTGLATTSQPSSSNLLVSNGAAGVYGVATSTLSATSPLTGSFVQLGSGGSLGCQTASGSQAGCLSAVDWSRFNSATTTFSYPLVYTGSTNAVTLAFGTTTANTWSALQTFGNASSSILSAATFCLTGDTCITSWPTGSGAPWPFVTSTNFGATNATTSLWFTSGVTASSTSQLVNVNVWNQLTLKATTSKLLATDSSGNVVATTSIGTNLLTGILAVANGGTASSTLTGILKGNGTNAVQTAVAGTDYQAPISATYPLLFSANTVSLAFGTTTANSWSALQTISAASTTNLTASQSFYVNSERIYGKMDKSFTIASSTLSYYGGWPTGTTSLMVWNPQRAITITDFYCTPFGGSAGTTTIMIGSGSASSTIICGSGVAGSATGLSITIAARGKVYIDAGGGSGSAAAFIPTVSYTSQ